MAEIQQIPVKTLLDNINTDDNEATYQKDTFITAVKGLYKIDDDPMDVEKFLESGEKKDNVQKIDTVAVVNKIYDKYDKDDDNKIIKEGYTFTLKDEKWTMTENDSDDNFVELKKLIEGIKNNHNTIELISGLSYYDKLQIWSKVEVDTIPLVDLDKIEDFEQDIQALAKNIMARKIIKMFNDAFKEQLNLFMDEKSKVTNRLAELREAISEFLMDKYSELKKDKDNNDAEMKKLQKKVDELQGEADKLKKQIAAAEGAKGAEGAEGDMGIQNAELKRELENKNAELKDTTENLNLKTKQFEKANQKITHLKAIIEELKKRSNISNTNLTGGWLKHGGRRKKIMRFKINYL